MNEIYSLIIEFFRQYNMVFLAVLIIIQGIGIPTGAGVLVMASGAFAYAGEYNVFLLFAEVWLLEIIADSIGYWTWRRFGKFILNTCPRVEMYLEPKLHKTGIFFRERGKAAILITRFPLSAVGSLVNATAGITKYKFKHFISTVMSGEFVWVAVYLGLGYWFGDAWETISDLMTQFGLLLGLIILLVIVLYYSYRILFKNRVYVKFK
ncbi:MAG TPA: VTT domain-containing protein [Desulfosporosinus sp.]|nr:VTT domain-containing protein [Desulfosporosinus sp.]